MFSTISTSAGKAQPALLHPKAETERCYGVEAPSTTTGAT